MLFDRPPKDFKKTLSAAACYLVYKEKFLMLKRLGDDGFKGKWAQPAGTMDKGETPIKAVIREVFEETRVNIKRKDLVFLKKFYIRYPKNDFTFYVYRTELKEKPEVILSHEHSEFKWVTPKQALKFDLIEDEDECIKRLFKIS